MLNNKATMPIMKVNTMWRLQLGHKKGTPLLRHQDTAPGT